ncbi:MAG: protein phosphatase 2C domain-containing protein [Gammaproteobacteria bacterium]|nr:protein phosphatase 2C domain-containing protein [Gammaproteobacteria bacterium]MCH9743705.1 protein phosphatase 2C domain-containing protein [Gammaproteobacteria bacterium]
MSWSCSAVTHTGHKRAQNEDAYLIDPELGLWAVADGMGGHRDGRLASQTIISNLSKLKPTPSYKAMQEQLRHCLTDVNYSLYHKGLTTPPYDVSGSTVALMLTQHQRCQCLWAGDSRIYLLRDRKLRQLSRDHSYVQKLIDNGNISLKEARNHPKANLITKAIGIHATVHIDAVALNAEVGDRFLICSDGLYNELSDKEIVSFLKQPSIEKACKEMLQLALSRDANDNITIVIVAFD